MTFTEKAISTFASQRFQCLWCDQHTLRLINDDSALVGILRVHTSTEYMEVVNAATIGGRAGLGHILYAAALVVAKQHGKKLRADSETVIGHSVSLWRKIWDDAAIPRQPLPFEMQQHEYNLDLYEDLLWTNPSLSLSDDWLDWDNDKINNKISSQHLTPHVFNIGFEASPQLLDAFSSVIEESAMSAEEQELVRAFWEHRFGRSE